MKANSDSLHPIPIRLSQPEAAQGVVQAMLALQAEANRHSLGHTLIELVKTRASQINHCAFCLDMHHRVALEHGESPERLALVAAWEEAPVFTVRERAALRWTEALTALPTDHVDDEVFAEVRDSFTEAELLELTLSIIAINGWNRLNVGFRIPPSALPRKGGTP